MKNAIVSFKILGLLVLHCLCAVGPPSRKIIERIGFVLLKQWENLLFRHTL